MARVYKTKNFEANLLASLLTVCCIKYHYSKKLFVKQHMWKRQERCEIPSYIENVFFRVTRVYQKLEGSLFRIVKYNAVHSKEHILTFSHIQRMCSLE